MIRAILKNPVYCGKIAFGRRKLEKIHGTRNEYHQVPQENYLLVDGLHEASYQKNCGTPHRSSCWRSPNDTSQSTAAKRNRRTCYPPLSCAPFAVLECTATNAPSERKMAHPINLSLITVASTARCNVGKNAISTSKFRKKFWTTPWWRLGCLPKRTPPV